MSTTRDEFKKKRLQAMGVVSAQMQASTDMFNRVIEAGSQVSEARGAAEAAHMGALAEQVADLKEMAEDMAEFAQAVPSNGGGSGTKPPAKATVQPSVGTAALAALNAAQPNPSSKAKGEVQTISSDEIGEGDAYIGTSPPNH